MACPNHGPDAFCTACPEHRYTDGYGFPQTAETGSRRGLRPCPRCGTFVERVQWHFDLGNGISCCKPCAPAEYDRIAKHLTEQMVGAPAKRLKQLRDAHAELRMVQRRFSRLL
jgi:hypothetical protein